MKLEFSLDFAKGQGLMAQLKASGAGGIFQPPPNTIVEWRCAGGPR